MGRLQIVLPALLIVILMLACGGSSPDEEPTAIPEPTAALVPTFTAIAPTAEAPTASRLLIVEPTSAPVLAPTVAVIVPTEPPQPVLAPPGATASDVANIRSGPGTDYPIVGSVAAGQPLEVVGRNAAGDWYQLADGNWIADFLVTGAPPDVAVVDAPVIEQPTVAPVVALPTDTPFTVVTEPPAAVCDCSGDTLNCGNFGRRGEAQACHDYCKAVTGIDIHKLDQNNDGNACESLPN